MRWAHGTTTGYYKYGCRCDECRDAASTYKREWRHRRGLHVPRPNAQGRSMRVRSHIIRDALFRDGRSVTEFCNDIGIPRSTYYHLVARGSGREMLVDTIACGLGLHVSQVEAR